MNLDMSIATLKFNDVSSETGYKSSSRALGASNIMDIPSYQTGYTAAVSNSFSNEQEQSFTESLISGNTRTETLMETMRPDKNYKGPDIDAKSMIRSADKVVTDGDQITRQANLGMEAVQECIADFQADWKQAKEECFDALKECTVDKPYSASDAVDAFIPGSAPTKATAMAYVAVETLCGGGTLSTMGKAAFCGGELSKEEKKLPTDEQKALLFDMQQNLDRSSSPNQDTRSNPMSGSSAPDLSSKESDIAWENMKIADLAEFMLADKDGLDQPEMQNLMQMENDIKVVKDNHEHVKNNYAATPTMEKIYHSAETGNDAMNNLLYQAQTVQVSFDSDFDSNSVKLTGASVNGIEVLVSDTSFDSTTVATMIDMNKIHIPEVQRQLDADIHAQMSFG